MSAAIPPARDDLADGHGALAHAQRLPDEPIRAEVHAMTGHPPRAASPLAARTCLTQLACLANALIQRGHEARLVIAAPFVAVRNPHGPGPVERIYLCCGQFRWADSPAGGSGIASQDDIPRAADTIAWALSSGPHTQDMTAPAAMGSRVYPPGGPAAEPGTP